MAHRTRTATSADIPQLVTLLDAAFGYNPTFEPRLRMYLALEPEGWVVVEGPTALVGVGGFMAFGRCAYVGLMAVAPEMQKRGMGVAIFEEILRRCEARSCSLLLLDASAPGAPLYEKYAFGDHGTALAFVVDPRTVKRLAGTSDAVTVRPVDVCDDGVSAELASLDARGFGADRSALVRHGLREFRGRAFAAFDTSGKVAGYAIGQPRSFGPCVAESADVARALLRHALTLPFEDRVTWLVPGQNQDAVDLATSLGCIPTRKWRHMRRGDASLLTADWSSLFAKASLAVG